MFAKGWEISRNLLEMRSGSPPLAAIVRLQSRRFGGHEHLVENGGPQMPLSDIAIRSAKPDEKPTKLADERGLFS